MEALVTKIQNLVENGAYNEAAETFAVHTKLKMKVEYLMHNFYFKSDRFMRDIYRITLRRGRRSYTFKFGQAVSNSNPPSLYDVLSCLTKYPVYSLSDFCSAFGYDMEHRESERVYNAVCKEWDAMNRLFTETEIEALREIM